MRGLRFFVYAGWRPVPMTTGRNPACSALASEGRAIQRGLFH